MNGEQVSLLGLGRMGAPIARRLQLSLGGLTVWNRSEGKDAALRQLGARVAASPAEAATDTVLTVLTDLSDVEAVLYGDLGLLAGWRANGIASPVLVVHGTVSPTGVAALARELSAHGVSVVDAPLSGGVAGAESGALSVMVGGESQAVERVLPVLRVVGSTVVVLGGPGAGEVAKACNQVVVAATVTAVSEALVLADANGIERSLLLDVLAGGLARSEVLNQKRERWLTRDYDGGGSALNQLKDLRFVQEAAAARGVTLPLAGTLTDAFDRMVGEGLGELDHSAIELVLSGERYASTKTG